MKKHEKIESVKQEILKKIAEKISTQKTAVVEGALRHQAHNSMKTRHGNKY